MKVARGIAPALVVSQVKNTAAWLWDDARASEVTRVFDRVDANSEASNDVAYLRLLLAAHWATVGTFVPTDLDVRIRHHAWVAIEDFGVLREACDVVDTIAKLPATIVSERVVASDHGSLSGHDGEWLGVRAGALGRALALGADDVIYRLTASIDCELERAEQLVQAALARFSARRVNHESESTSHAAHLLAIATTVAHNLGDLSRVVEQWPKRVGTDLETLRPRYTRLGHADAPSRRKAFVIAGVLNKALVAHENHRFLPLRRPRALRTSRSLLLPFGPWFDRWGNTIATSPLLEDRDRGEIVEALLDVHHARPEELGCLRALAGIHCSLHGGLEKLVPLLPARMRKDALRGRVREALDITETHFAARMDRRLRSEIEKL